MSQNSGGRPGHPPRVLIVGGGIGGLCLVQGLKKSGIAVTLFERNQSAVARRQGYGFHINSHGSQALHECLPERLFRPGHDDAPGQRGPPYGLSGIRRDRAAPGYLRPSGRRR
jgi:2-polyprenyl-6-methoxyphenol hydroxylase-like FAD-dependent oxidoreductase